jgi:hypothetical protein
MGKPVIIGDESLVVQIENNISLVAPFRQAEALAILARYHANENSVTPDEEQFLFRCAADIVDN